MDLAANAESLGARVLRAATIEELRGAVAEAKRSAETTVVYVETDPLIGAPSEAWWDVPVVETAPLASTREARAVYENAKKAQRPYL